MQLAQQAPETGPIAKRDAILPPRTYRPPATPAERRMAAIWRAALDLDRVGIDDDFFLLGGDSMAATLVCAEVERLTGRPTEPHLLLDAPTIADFAVAIEGDMRRDAARSLIEIRPGGGRPPLVLIHGLDGQIMFVRRLAWLLPCEQPLYGLQARGLDGAAPPHASAGHLLEDYAAQITAAFDGREIWLGGFCMGGALAVGVAHLLKARGVACRGLVLIDPPIEPGLPRDIDADRRLLREWYDTLAERIAPFARGYPGLAAHYAPDGAGLHRARAVMRSLLRTYAGYVPRPIDLGATVIWSQERAEMRGGHERSYRLATGPGRAHVVLSPKGIVTHRRLLQDGIAAVAQGIRGAIGLASPGNERPGSLPRGAG